MAIRSARPSRPRGFTLLEVALIIAIIGMMLLIIIGYLVAPKARGPLPPLPESSPVLPPTPEPLFVPTPAPRVTPATPEPAVETPAPATPAAPAPVQTIEISPQATPSFR